MTPMIVGIAGGPEAGGRTSTAISGVLAGAATAGADTSLLELSSTPVPDGCWSAAWVWASRCSKRWATAS